MELVTTSYGQPARDALARCVNLAKRGDPLAKVTVVVPTNYAGLAARRGLAQRGVSADRGGSGVAAVDALTALGLAERLGGAALADKGRRSVSNAVIAGAVRSVLQANPGRFSGVEAHPATSEALAEAHRELSDLNEHQLEALSRRSARAGEVVRVHRQVTAVLRPRYSDDQELVETAVECALADPSEARRQLGAMIVFLPQRLSASQARLLREVSEAVDTTVIAGLTGAADADVSVMESLERLKLPLARGESGSLADRSNLPVDAKGHDNPASSSLRSSGDVVSHGWPQIRAMSVSDADEEARHAVRAVVNAAREGVPLARCAILYGTADPYERLTCDALDIAGIARCGANALKPDTAWLGRCLLNLLALSEDGLSRPALMAWLSDAQLWIRDDEAGRVPAPVAAWERVARAAGVTGGIDDWRSRLGLYARDRRDEAGRPIKDDERMWLIRRLRSEADLAERLEAFVAELHDHLKPPARASWASFANWCEGLVRVYLGGRHRQSWPEEQRRLAEVVDASVRRLADLDGIDNAPSLSAFSEALKAELDGAQTRHGRFGTGVLVGGVATATGVDLDFAVVCGLAEGIYPARRRESSLLPDRERRGVDLAARGDRSGDDHRALLEVLASASSSLLLFPRGDLRRSSERTPSRWLREIEQQRRLNGADTEPGGAAMPLASTSRDGSGETAPTVLRSEIPAASEWLEEVPSFVSGLRRMDFAAHEQEYNVRAALDWQDSLLSDSSQDERGGRVGLETLRSSVFAARPALWRGVEMRLARAGHSFTRFDGNLAAGDLRGAHWRSPDDPTEVTSASRLEAWTTCPHAYLVRHILGVDAVEDEADSIRISPLERGNLIHRILERWVTQAIADDAQPAAGEPWSASQRQRLAVIGEEECDALKTRGLVGRRLYWHIDRRRILADLRRFVDFDDAERAALLSTPVAAELGFGMPDSAQGPVEIALEDHRRLRVRGSIDRLDVTEDGALVVIDYKTGSIRDYEKLSDADPKPEGGHLQLVLYALAARTLRRGASGVGDRVGSSAASADKDHGAYWFVSTRSSKLGGFETRGYRVELTRARVLDAVGEIVNGIRAGVFPARPEPSAWGGFVSCHFCEPDGLGVRELLRDWQRKCLDPALADYLSLIGETETQQ